MTKDSLDMKKIFGSVAILSLSVLFVFFLIATKPEPKVYPPDKLIHKVKTESFKRGSYPATFTSTGKIRSSKHLDLHSSISGTIAAVSGTFIPGYLVSKGDLLITLADSFYANKVKQYEALYEQAKAAYDVEIGKQSIAKEGVAAVYEVTGSKPKNQALMMRVPQLQHAESELKKAKSELDIAKNDLASISIKSPFNAMVLDAYVHNSSVIDEKTLLGKLVGTDQYWVELSVPGNILPWLAPRNKKIDATVYPNHSNEIMAGYVLKTVMALDDTTRMGRLIIAIDDPLRSKEVELWRNTSAASEHPIVLMLNDFVKVKVDGRIIDDVVKLPINYLRPDNAVWLFVDGKLEIRSVKLVYKDIDSVYVKDGVNANDLVITSDIGIPVEGMHLESIVDKG